MFNNRKSGDYDNRVNFLTFRTGLTVDVRPESKKLETQDPYLTVTPGKDPLARMEKVLRLHCINLQMSVSLRSLDAFVI